MINAAVNIGVQSFVQTCIFNSSGYTPRMDQAIFFLINFYRRTVAVQRCVSFYCTAK